MIIQVLAIVLNMGGARNLQLGGGNVAAMARAQGEREIAVSG